MQSIQWLKAKMASTRVAIAIFAIAGSLVGGVVGMLAAPTPSHFIATATVVMNPDSSKTSGQWTAFWSVLHRGQVTRQAAILFEDPRWLHNAAVAAGVPDSDLTLRSYVLSETVMLKVEATTTSRLGADRALDELLRQATPAVADQIEPFNIQVIWPTENSATPVHVPDAMQTLAAGVICGGLLGAGIGGVLIRSGRFKRALSRHSR